MFFLHLTKYFPLILFFFCSIFTPRSLFSLVPFFEIFTPALSSSSPFSFPPLFTSASQEQHQVLLYQLMQQQDLQQLQSLSSSAQIPSIPLSSAQLSINNLLPGAQSQGQGAITANPFLALQHAHTDTHASGAQKPRLAEKAVGVAGQEKTWRQMFFVCFSSSYFCFLNKYAELSGDQPVGHLYCSVMRTLAAETSVLVEYYLC